MPDCNYPVWTFIVSRDAPCLILTTRLLLSLYRVAYHFVFEKRAIKLEVFAMEYVHISLIDNNDCVPGYRNGRGLPQ